MRVPRPAVEVVTFGCRLNIVESEAIRQAAEAAGHRDLIVVNTCAVTGEAVRQARQSIRRIKRENPDLTVVVTGCAAQTEPGTFADMPEVTQVIGNDLKTRSETWQRLSPPASFGIEGSERVLVNDIMATRETAGHMLEGLQGHTRGFLQVQNGCDHRCTFCIIPFGRGNSRSVPMGEVVDAVRRLVDNGYGEVVLTGVDITSYGADLPGQPGLGRLVRAVLRHVPELRRLRISSIDSIEVDDDLMQALAEEERLMPHLHLSLQSGADMILKRMKRRHSRADAIRFCEEVRRLRPDIVFGADIIAGFPTETEEMFGQSLDIVDTCGLTHLHVFPFSPREGTPAAKMPQLPRAIIKNRAAALRDKGEAAYLRHLDTQTGRRVDLMMEANGLGRSADFTTARTPIPTFAGMMVRGIVTGHDGRHLTVLADNGEAGYPAGS